MIMNERIRELAEQAGFCHDINNGIYLCAPMHMEKFAELLVMECMTICEELGDRGMDGHYCADEINKRFRGA